MGSGTCRGISVKCSSMTAMINRYFMRFSFYALRVSLQSLLLHLITRFSFIFNILKICDLQNLPRNFGLQSMQNCANTLVCRILHFLHAVTVSRVACIFPPLRVITSLLQTYFAQICSVMRQFAFCAIIVRAVKRVILLDFLWFSQFHRISDTESSR